MPRKAFLIRLDPAVLTAIEAWAGDDLRSVNAQIEFLLREALRKAGRKVKTSESATDEAAGAQDGGATTMARSSKA